eukprot:764530-Hanusia_phi.AAC.1
MTDANGDYVIDRSGNNINLRLKRKGTTGNFPTVTSSSVKGNGALNMNYVNTDIAYGEIDVKDNDVMGKREHYWIGAGRNDIIQQFNGNFDDFRIYDVELTPAQVTELYTGSVI